MNEVVEISNKELQIIKDVDYYLISREKFLETFSVFQKKISKRLGYTNE